MIIENVDPIKIVNIALQSMDRMVVRDVNGWTPLHLAVLKEDLEEVTRLLANGANPNLDRKPSGTPLHLAATKGLYDIVVALILSGANINATNAAIDKYYDEIMKCLLLHGADIHAKTNTGLTPLHLAMYSGDIKLVSYLLDNGASSDVNATHKGEVTPLHIATSNDHQDLVILLLRNGANDAEHHCRTKSDVNARNAGGWTPLHIAMCKKYTDLTDILLKHGADSTIRDNKGRLPSEVAV